MAARDVEALDPHLFQQNAWVPMRPMLVEDVAAGVYDVIYDTSIYDMPVPSGTTGPVTSGGLYSYFVVAPTSVDIQASVYNSRIGREIYSNTITVDISIPDYMNGVWELEEINQLEIDEISSLLTEAVASGQKIPLGWRLKTSNIVLAGALDGVTFLDVNPRYNANVWDEDDVTPLGHEVNVSSIV